MGHKLLITLLVVTACHVGFLLAADCEPSCVDTSTALLGERKCLPPTTMVEDPKNCSQYYFCLADCAVTQHPLPCGTGEAFNPVAADCSGTFPCDPSCSISACHLTCNGTGDMIGDANDCSKYYICYPHGPEGPFTCGADAPYFNGETCVVEESECCKPECSPWCDAVGTQVADPFDCHKYYICVEAGVIPEESVHFTCNNGQVFDVSLGRCTADSKCQVLCTEGSSSPAASTTPSSASTASAVSSTGGVTPTSECLDTLTCIAAGNFAKCLTCQPDYFYCSGAGAQGEQRQCSGNLVFNPDPNYPYCVQPTNCPYSP